MKKLEDYNKVQEVTDLDIAFGQKAMELLPPYEMIPKEFKMSSNKWNKVITDWFYYGIKIQNIVPNDGIDAAKAMRHIKAIMGSFNPKHEHKEAGCSYLLSVFFKDIKYTAVK